MMFEWCDFYLYGTLVRLIGAQFFTPLYVAFRNMFALLALGMVCFNRLAMC